MEYNVTEVPGHNLTAVSPILNYSSLYRTMSVAINVVIFLVGIVGNVLVVVVVFRTRSMRTPTNCYLMSLAIADCLVLLSATLPAIPETFYQIDEWPFGPVMCPILVFSQYLGVDVSALSITAFTIERYVAICHPLRSQTICTVKRANRIIAGIWIFSILYCSPWLGLAFLQKVPRQDILIDVCTMRLSRPDYLTTYLADLIIFYVIPLVITIVLYSRIARILFKSSITQQDACLSTTSKRNRKRQITSRLQVVRMLAVIVFVFMTTWLPYKALVVYNSFAKKRYMDLWFLMFCRTMIYVNSAVNPILYNAMSVKFRRAFKRILCCGLSANEAQITVYSELNMDNTIVLPRRGMQESKIGHRSFNGTACRSNSNRGSMIRNGNNNYSVRK